MRLGHATWRLNLQYLEDCWRIQTWVFINCDHHSVIESSKTRKVARGKPAICSAQRPLEIDSHDCNIAKNNPKLLMHGFLMYSEEGDGRTLLRDSVRVRKNPTYVLCVAR